MLNIKELSFIRQLSIIRQNTVSRGAESGGNRGAGQCGDERAGCNKPPD